MLKYFLKCASYSRRSDVMIASELTTVRVDKEENGEKKHFLISKRVFMQISSKSQAQKKFSCDLAGAGVISTKRT